MDLTLQHHNLMNTTFLTPDSVPLYTTYTGIAIFGAKPTLIQKLLGPPQNQTAEMAKVEVHSWSSDIVSVWGNLVGGLHRPMMTESIEWTGPDGKAYKWKHHIGGDWSLVSRSHSNHDLAYFDSGRTLGIPTKTATLRVGPEVLHILDQMIATLVFAEKKYRQRQRAKNNAGAAST